MNRDDMDGEQESVLIINQVVESISKRGLEQLALFFFEMFRPLAGCTSILTEASAPMISMFLGHSLNRQVQTVLGNREHFDLLIQKLIECVDRGVSQRG